MAKLFELIFLAVTYVVGRDRASAAGDRHQAGDPATPSRPAARSARPSTGRNDPHVSQPAKDSAADELADAIEKLEELERENPRGQGYKKRVAAAKKRVDHWRRKAQATGEEHHRRANPGMSR